ncbi:MEDS domain-containing protein [Sulfuriferula multivorans]|nr:MEDS domain-containing protein [Sulfuriferula multivorans]
MPWRNLLTHPEAGNHIAQICRDEAFLVNAVTQFVGAGINDGAASIVIATPAHRRAFIASLEHQGHSVQNAKGEGKIKFFDAESLLSSLMSDGMPVWKAFEKHIGSLMRETQSQHKNVRVYGEKVNLLWQKNKLDAAIRLEEFWNELSQQLNFSRLCTYTMDNLDPGVYEGSLERICKCHSHLIPTENYALLENVVQKATNDLLGRDLTDAIGKLALSRPSTTQMPPAQATLLFLSEKLPLSARKILSRVQREYALAAAG